MQFTYKIPTEINSKQLNGNYYMAMIVNPFNSLDENNFDNNIVSLQVEIMFLLFSEMENLQTCHHRCVMSGHLLVHITTPTQVMNWLPCLPIN